MEDGGVNIAQELLSGAWQGVGQSLLAPILTLIVLPVIYGLVGANKRERRERVAQALRLDVDLARGLADLSQTAQDNATRARLKAMHDEAVADFLTKAEEHYEMQRSIGERPYRDKLLLPNPTGFFGFVWSALAIFNSFVAVFLAIAFVILMLSPPEDRNVYNQAIGFTFLLVVFIGLTLLFRWAAFRSAKFGFKAPMSSQSQSAMTS